VIQKLKYELNQSFFDSPENWTENQAYWFGWMYSDGSNNLKNNSISIKLQESDKEVLEKLKTLIGYSGPLNFIYRNPSSILGGPTKKYQNRYCLTIYCKKLSSQLEKLGMVSGKAEKSPFPSFLKDELRPAFIRGVFEGDGTFSISKWNKFESNLVGSDVFLDEIENFLKKADISCYRVDPKFNNKCKILRFCGNNTGLRFFNLIYKNHKGLFLKRKYEKFIQLFEIRKNLKSNKKQIAALEETLKTINENEKKKNFDSY
jgi:hypothetical protein